MVSVSTVLAAYALFSFLVPQRFFPAGSLPITDGVTRLHYSAYTYYFSQFIPLLWVWMLRVRGSAARIAILFLSGLEIALVLLSGLRAAWIAMLLGLVVYLASRSARLAPVVGTIAVGLTALIMLGPQSVAERISMTAGSTDVGLTGRLDELQTVWLPLIQQHPFGLGTGTFSSSASLRWQPVFGPLNFQFAQNGVTHNGYLEVLAELGPGGFVAYIVLLAAALRKILKNRKVLRNGLTQGLNTVALAQLVSYCAIGFFTPVPILFPVNMYFYLFLGLIVVLPRIDNGLTQEPRATVLADPAAERVKGR
jgi:O-antigen ligase